MYMPTAFVDQLALRLLRLSSMRARAIFRFVFSSAIDLAVAQTFPWCGWGLDTLFVSPLRRWMLFFREDKYLVVI